MEAAVTKVDVVTLVTGDRVRLSTYSDGRASAVLLAGSPHAGQPVKTVQAGGTTYVIPRLPLSEQRLYDVSMFNVTALAALPSATVPVALTFAEGVTPHDVGGFTVDTRTTRPSADDSRTVSGHYRTATASGSIPDVGAEPGLVSVALPSGVTTPHVTGATTHTLTIHVVDTHGEPVKNEIAFVQNVDDASVFYDEVLITDGVGSVAVPAGNYAVFAGSFTRTVIEPDFAVEDDTSLHLDLADATVRPTETVPGHHTADAGVSLERDAARGGGLVQILQSDRFVFALQPVAAHLPHGKMWTSVSAAHAPADELAPPGGVYSMLAFTKDYRSGVPDDLGFTHPRSDFAIVAQKLYANGPAARHSSDALAFAPYEIFSFATEFPVRVPSLRTIWLQGDDALLWEQDYQPTGSFSDRPASLTKYSRYTAGTALPVSFAHGPVGPGVEAAYDVERLGFFCLLCRNGDRLSGSMPLFSGAGTAMSGLLGSPQMGSWSLRQGDDVLDAGSYVLAPDVTLPAARRAYTLQASSHPGVKSWQLSTEVSDVWTFTSGSSRAVVPLLMPSYVPRTALDGSLAAGPTRFPMDFGNLGPVDARVSKATVELSTDAGSHWTKATVTRVDRSSFAVTYDSPPPAGSQDTMSLRVTGVDAAGRTVTETALDAYRLAA